MASGTRERIMDVALQLFAERGVAATPVTAIEAAAGLSAGSGSFYRHFKDKQALLAAVVEREIALVRKDPAVPAAGTLAGQLLSDLDFLGRLRPLMTILMWERNRAPEVAEHVQQVMADRGVELGTAEELAVAPVEAVRADPQAAAAVMMSAMTGYFLTTEYFGRRPAGIDPQRFASTLARLLTG
ncbi:AcrR family transcriptional regulator [Kibdelosporangium banguiense]|uniref:AcrR family transcriptional regulator n=1 Tax=Kibdelosporangium banguiense TaxID=1365924 RepID=A0ABS4T591_9PSEU|nr:TetR family transcriptional regulator [Kibdelosporangium banguiense]MBP2319645.1 AcrR family transcriptional regulator [Kibdelosporangium banguiense]